MGTVRCVRGTESPDKMKQSKTKGIPNLNVQDEHVIARIDQIEDTNDLDDDAAKLMPIAHH